MGESVKMTQQAKPLTVTHDCLSSHHGDHVVEEPILVYCILTVDGEVQPIAFS